MKRLAVDQEVALSVGNVTVDCKVGELLGGEVALVPLGESETGSLPAASAGASLVFTHGGRLVMLRGAMYRATSDDDIRFAEKTVRAAAAASAEQRRKAARLPITLPATIVQLDAAGEAFGEERQLITKDLSIGGFAVGTGVGSFPVGRWCTSTSFSRAARSSVGRRASCAPRTRCRGCASSSLRRPSACGSPVSSRRSRTTARRARAG